LYVDAVLFYFTLCISGFAQLIYRKKQKQVQG